MVTNTHKDNNSTLFDQPLNLNANEDLGNLDERLEETCGTSYFKEHIVGPESFEKFDLRGPFLEYPLSSYIIHVCHEEKDKYMSLEEELGEIENDFWDICFEYTLFKNQNLKENLMRPNNIKMKKL